MATQAALERAIGLVPGLLKAWVWSRISRKAHAAAEERFGPDEGPIPIDRPFIVDGEELMFPRDPSGSPQNTINCGCFHVPVVPDFGKVAAVV